VAYGSLLQERRRVLHAQIVEAIEALYADRVVEQVERLTHHAQRGEVWDKALPYCRQAGEKALAHSAHREAVGYFEQALGALEHLPEQRNAQEQAIDLRLALRSALRPIGDFGRILACLREAEALAQTLDDPHRLGQVSLFLSVHFFLRGVYDQAMAFDRRTLALATAGTDAVLHMLASQRLGLAYQAQGDYRRAIDCLGQTMTFFDGERRHERFGMLTLPAVLASAHLAMCYAELGMFAAGRSFGEEGLRIAEVAAHPGSLMYASHGLGLLFLRQGDLPRTLPLLERAVSLCHEADLPAYFPWMAAVLAAAHILCGRGAAVVPLLTQAIEQATIMEMATYQMPCHLALGEAQVLVGRLEEAHALAERALALTREHHAQGYQAYALYLLGDIAAQHDPLDVDQAAIHYRQALALANELGMRPLQAHCHRGLGTLYSQMGQIEQAHAELSTAIEMYRDMEMTFWLPETEAALAEVEKR
jgi:tetratricopeptide (TPR) repeat protein